MKTVSLTLLFGLFVSLGSCKKIMTFGHDVQFLKRYTDVILLKDGSRQVALAPKYQGRVMTSTTGGSLGPSFGFLNYDVIKKGIKPEAERKGTLQQHIHVFGGEDRFWLGPEGGQFAIFFKPGSKFDFALWQTPAAIDTDGYQVVEQSAAAARFTHSAVLTNHSGFKFDIGIDRTIQLMAKDKADAIAGTSLPDGVKFVGYTTTNILSNKSKTAWTEKTGMLSIWLLGMFKPGADTVVVIPFKEGPEAELGAIVNDGYFGKVPPDFLQVKGSAIYFKGDGTRRGKIGVTPQRSLGIAGSFDPKKGTLTLVTYNQPEKYTGYVNSEWKMQDKPFAGDAINSYNDGAPEPGADPLGPFYEIETSSPAAPLGPGESITHTQSTIHLQGDRAVLDEIAKKKLGVSLAEITSVFQ